MGVDPGTGDAIYHDKNNDGALTADDGTFIGDAQPDYFGGLPIRLHLKDLMHHCFSNIVMEIK